MTIKLRKKTGMLLFKCVSLSEILSGACIILQKKIFFNGTKGQTAMPKLETIKNAHTALKESHILGTKAESF